MWNLKSSPPLAPLVALVSRLESGGVPCALGGSGLLAALGLAHEVRDWDLTTDASLDHVREIVRDLPYAHSGHIDVHVDDKLIFDGEQLELIVRFALRSSDGVVRIPTIVVARRENVPLGSPEAWAVAYALMDRAAKAKLLFDHLKDHGADRSVVERLLHQPLPDGVRTSLLDLPAA